MVTSFENKTRIMSDFVDEYQDDERFAEFIALRNLGFPLAVAVQSEMVTGITDNGAKWIELCFDDLLALFGKTDRGFVQLYEVMGANV